MAIGNGTASRETKRFSPERADTPGESHRAGRKLIVSEAGASGLLGFRAGGAGIAIWTVHCVAPCLSPSLCRNPLAELVKINPK
ncbi:hypothetical protein ACNKHK_21950 [Shigella flexneri]